MGEIKEKSVDRTEIREEDYVPELLKDGVEKVKITDATGETLEFEVEDEERFKQVHGGGQ